MYPQTPAPAQPGKTILNNNYGMTNIIGHKDIVTIMLDTFKFIADRLQHHCGLYGRMAMIIPQSKLENPKHTRDGINIVRDMDFVNPMEEYCRRTLEYVGDKIEKEIGDCTTSGMITVATMIAHILKGIADGDITGFSYQDITKAYDLFMKEFRREITMTTMTVEKLAAELEISDEEAIEKIAYAQALTSSGGDHKVATIVSELFSKRIPESTWSHISYRHEIYETEEALKLEVEKSQYGVEGMVFRNAMCNSDDGRGVKYENVRLLVSTMDMMENNKQYIAIKAAIMEHIEADKPLVIITPTNVDGFVRQQLDEIFNKYPMSKIAIIQTQMMNPVYNDITGLLVAAGSDLAAAATELIEFPDVSINFTKGVVNIDGIYDNPEDSVIHPRFETDPELQRYLSSIEETIERIMQDPHERQANEMIAFMRRMYNKVYLTSRTTVVVGGNSYDNEYYADVMHDALSAVKNTLRDGFIIAGPYQIFDAISSSSTALDEAGEYNGVVPYIVNAAASGCVEVMKGMVKFKPSILPEGYDLAGGAMINLANGEEIILKDILDTTKSIPVQPAKAASVALDRFGEVAMKFFMTDCIINPGGVYVNNEE